MLTFFQPFTAGKLPLAKRLVMAARGKTSLSEPTFPEKKPRASTMPLTSQYLQTGIGESVLALGSATAHEWQIFSRMPKPGLDEKSRATAQKTFTYLRAFRKHCISMRTITGSTVNATRRYSARLNQIGKI